MWMDGDLEDDELTDAEVEDLGKRVRAAVWAKINAREGVHTFPQHMTVQ